ncbi:MAG TPA: hypothetical protein VGH01_11615 [Jatrophihabitantaceae bacterium]
MTNFERLARRRRLMLIGTAFLSLLALILVPIITLSGGNKNSDKNNPKTGTAYGTVSIASKNLYVVDPVTGCHGYGDYTDLAPGGLVTITDISGNTLTTTHLDKGKVDENGFCELDFSAPDVPTNRGPYGIQITRRKLVQNVNQSDLFTRITLSFGTPG